MNTTVCDVCGKGTPEVNCSYSKRKKWGWFRFDFDSQGGSNKELDICEKCWEMLSDMCKMKHAYEKK